MARGQGNDIAGSHEESKTHPPAALNDNGSRSRSLLQTPRNESVQSEPGPREPSTTEALNREEERRRKIVEALQNGQPYKNVASRILDKKEQYSEAEINSIVNYVYGIDYSNPDFIFQDKMPGRMLVGNKWKRTDLGHIVDGRSYLYQPDKPETIRRRSYNIENSHRATTSNLCDRGKQVISRPSIEKYGYLPQFHEELSSSMPGFYGNSDDVEGFLVGGKEKLQEIRRELGSDNGARISGESQEKDNEGTVLSRSHSSLRENKKILTLWDIDLYEKDFPEDEDVEEV